MTELKSAPPTLIPLPMELRGRRILLRPYRADDAESVFAAIDESRDHLRPWLPWVDHHVTIDDTHDYCIRSAANWMLRSDLPLGLFALKDGGYLGGTGLHSVDWSLRSFEIGYWLRVSAEGHGFMTEAVRLLSTFALDELRANRIEIYCDAINVRSRAVAERSGFILEGRLRNARLNDEGLLTDSLVFSMVPSDERFS